MSVDEIASDNKLGCARFWTVGKSPAEDPIGVSSNTSINLVLQQHILLLQDISKGVK